MHVRVSQIRVWYFLIGLSSFLAGMLIFFFSTGFIRGTVGDFLVVIFLYASVKVFFPQLRPLPLSLGVFTFSALIEVGQHFGLPNYFGRNHLFTKLILGSDFNWLDMGIYALGCWLIGWIDDRWIIGKSGEKGKCQKFY